MRSGVVSEPNDWLGGADRADVRDALARVLASKEFDAAPRHRQFLQYVVEETLAGRADRIKAFNVAMTVFGRDESFDPQIDPIVRIGASRLRRALQHYYLTAGQEDPLRIEIPKGSYVPTFEVRSSPADLEQPAAQGLVEQPAGAGAVMDRGWLSSRRPLLAGAVALSAILLAAVLLMLLANPVLDQGPDGVGAAMARHPVVLVVPFDDESIEPIDRNLASGITRELVDGLTRFRNLFVLAHVTSRELHRRGTSPDDIERLNVDYLVTGNIRVDQDRFIVSAALVDARTGQNVWSNRFERIFVSADLFAAVRDVSDRIVSALAQRHGAIFNETVKEIAGRAPQSLTSYGCVLLFDSYNHQLNQAKFDEVRSCLEQAVAEEPDYARGHASLALAYTEAHRFELNAEMTSGELLERAFSHARRAIELSAYAVDGYLALHEAYWLSNATDLSFEAGETGLALNPNDVDLMATMGARYCLVGQWDRGVALLEAALARSPTHSSIYRLPLALHHYVNGDYESALIHASNINLPHAIMSRAMLAMTYARLGRMAEAEAEISAMLALNPNFAETVEAELRARNLYPDLIEIVLQGLREAGLQVPNIPEHASEL